ncbi:hypothetical protein NEMBOFW57_004072 [Staphylotrichum longicolle]|uniref:Major facilitator superfamily (MFS) profile domain-containing protein n=1 Tax=Staphylotrichum longicolle TaxID=669026 RepID=A0AAD4F639_9PEZI|nr:hypothetical protein NEMBOFW57_004072 [Staphylotrichum longicolle]
MGGGGDSGAAASTMRRFTSRSLGPDQELRVFRIAAFACIGGVLYGYNQGMFSGVLAMPAFNNHMGEYTTDQTKKGWLTAILELGAWIGTLLSGFLAEVLSRKYAVLVACAVFIIGVIVQATAVSGGHDAILGGRFVTGMGVGSLAMIIPIYNSEVAPPEVRGALVATQQLAICFGIMISFWIDYGTNFIGGTEETQSDAAWLVPICLQLAPAVLLFVGMIFMPFSPRWLIHHGREEEARKVLSSLRGLSADHELVELEFLEIKAQSLFEKRTIAELFPQLREQTAWNTFKLQFVAIRKLFQTKAMFKRVVVATVTMFFQQGASQAAAGWAAVCMVWLFVIHFGYSWGPCAWIIVAEIWPLSTRPYGVALGASSN